MPTHLIIGIGHQGGHPVYINAPVPSVLQVKTTNTKVTKNATEPNEKNEVSDPTTLPLTFTNLIPHRYGFRIMTKREKRQVIKRWQDAVPLTKCPFMPYEKIAEETNRPENVDGSVGSSSRQGAETAGEKSSMASAS